MSTEKLLYLVAITLVVIGGINWGLVGIANFDLVSFIFGNMSILSRLVYGLVGLSAMYIAFDTIVFSRSDNFH